MSGKRVSKFPGVPGQVGILKNINIFDKNPAEPK